MTVLFVSTGWRCDSSMISTGLVKLLQAFEKTEQAACNDTNQTLPLWFNIRCIYLFFLRTISPNIDLTGAPFQCGLSTFFF